jgi:flagellar L-ring protein FlgH
MCRFVSLFAFILVVGAIAPVSADPLWTPNATSLCADTKAQRVGDLVTIIIAESTSSSQKTSSDFDKSVDHSNAAGIGPFLKAIPPISYNSTQKGSSGGATMMTNQLITKLTATVTEVLPNGNLKLSAVRSVVTNAEKQDITLTGTVRAIDVGSDNTVLSTYVADVEIKYTGKGPAGDRQKEGFLSKLLKFLF